MAVEDDGRGGRGCLEQGHDLIEALLGGGGVLGQRDAEGLNLFILTKHSGSK